MSDNSDKLVGPGRLACFVRSLSNMFIHSETKTSTDDGGRQARCYSSILPLCPGKLATRGTHSAWDKLACLVLYSCTRFGIPTRREHWAIVLASRMPASCIDTTMVYTPVNVRGRRIRHAGL